MTVNMLIQIDKLVQLLESPVFTCKLSIKRTRSGSDPRKIYDFSCSNRKGILISISAYTDF